jgi:hypothetical protein
MTERERINYEILKFLNQPSVRKDVNITDEILAYQVKDYDPNIYEAQINGLVLERAIARTSANANWQITKIGEVELNRLSRELVKDNPVAAKLQDEVTVLQIANYKNQIKQFEERRQDSFLKYLGTVSVTLLSVFIGCWLNKKPENVNKRYQIEVFKHSPIDTVYVINSSDTLKKSNANLKLQ